MARLGNIGQAKQGSSCVLIWRRRPHILADSSCWKRLRSGGRDEPTLHYPATGLAKPYPEPSAQNLRLRWSRAPGFRRLRSIA